jgi:hypothetical protein
MAKELISHRRWSRFTAPALIALVVALAALSHLYWAWRSPKGDHGYLWSNAIVCIFGIVTIDGLVRMARRWK